MSNRVKPPTCTHKLFPSCGCQPLAAPALSSHLIVERDRKAKEKENPKRGRGRPPTPWKARSEHDEFLEALPSVIDDPYARANLLRMIDAQLYISSFSEFVRAAWHVVEPTTTLEWNWHHEFICTVMQKMFEDWERGQDDRKHKLLVQNCVMNVPPGSLKSKLLCVMFPVWAWLRRPGVRFVCLSVNETAAHRDARDSRALLMSDWFEKQFEPEWHLKEDQDAVSNYGTDKGGVRLSRAQGSEIVGLRGDIILIDDPNNPKDSESKIIRDSVNETWRTNISNRINHPTKSIRIGIQQRVHMEDWTGFVTHPDNGGVWSPTNRSGWLLVALPAEFEPDRKCVTPWGEDIRTEKGQSLHPDRMTEEFLADEKRRFGSQKYAGQMQQRPTLAEGGMVKMRWWRFFHYDGQEPIKPADRKLGDEIDKQHQSLKVEKKFHSDELDFDWTVISVDPAAKRTERGSQHGILVVAGKGLRRFVLDDKTTRGDILDVIKIIKSLCRQYSPQRIIMEGKAAGPSLITMFEDEFQRGLVTGRDGRPLRVIVDDIDPQGDKATRLDACLPELEAGLVYLKDGADWLEPFIGEVCGYPSASYNDRPDALSQCLNHMRTWNSYQLPKW